MPESILFTVTDPRGYTVICTELQWKDHILDGHPDMAGEEEQVKKAIESPSLGIYSDVKYPERHIYYDRHPRYNLYTKVVVVFDSNKVGEVKTAFLTDSPKRGEKLLWLG